MNKNIAIQIEEAINVSDSLNLSLRLTEEEQIFFAKNFKKEDLKKNDFVIREGEKEYYLYFIERGLLRYWATDYDDKEVTFWFSIEGEFANSYLSLKDNQPSEFNIQALCNSTIWKLSREKLSYLYSTSLNVNKIARIVLQDALIRKIKRETSLLKLTAEERYKEFLEKEKYLLNTVPLKYIASYLGITPQGLSRIRKRIK